MPLMASTPESYACFTLRMSVTVSATSTSAAGASRRVHTTLTFAGRDRMATTTSSPSIHPQLMGYVISSSTTSRCAPAAMTSRACAHAARATASSSERSCESQVKPSPSVHQSTPSRSRHTFSSPTRQLPDFTNCTTATRQSRATERSTTPNADDDFPLPSPVFTTTTLSARRRAGLVCSRGGSCVMRSLLSQRQDDGAAAVVDDAHAGAVVAGEVVLGQHVAGRTVDDDAAVVEEHEPLGVLPREREVVHRGHDGEASLTAESVDHLEHLLLVTDVERSRRLVQEHDR